MSLEEFKARYRRALEEAYYKGNLDALDELYAPDVVIHRPPHPDIRGLGEYKQHVLTARQAYSCSSKRMPMAITPVRSRM